MNILAALVGVLLIYLVLQDGFETIILPRQVSRRFRLSRTFYRTSWKIGRAIAKKIRTDDRREQLLSFYGPLSLIILLILWAIALVVAFALLQWSLGSSVSSPEKVVTFWTDLYMSGTTFFTLGYGDVVPREGIARLCAVIEAGLGFAFLALIIGYVPVIYQAFSRREVHITLLDARAGSPPSAIELLRRHLPEDHNADELIKFLSTWEQWASDVLESHLSYPVLAYYRSQHDRQSWLSALTTILDVSALLMTGLEGMPKRANLFPFAIARHAAVDLAQIFSTPPTGPQSNRLSSADFARICQELDIMGLHFLHESMAEERLASFRALYEPYVTALANYLLLPLPEWVRTTIELDDWQSSAWDTFSLTTQRPLSILSQRSNNHNPQPSLNSSQSTAPTINETAPQRPT
jgi:hypothetical protein